jgi:hypothetical protein
MITAMNCADGTKRLAVVARMAVGIEGHLEVVEAVSRAGRCEVGDIIEGDAAGVEYVVAVFAGGHGVAGVEGAAETGTAKVVYEAIDIEASRVWLRVGTVAEGAGEVNGVVRALAVVGTVAAATSFPRIPVVSSCQPEWPPSSFRGASSERATGQQRTLPSLRAWVPQGSPGLSISDLDVRALKTLYTPNGSSPGTGAGTPSSQILTTTSIGDAGVSSVEAFACRCS